MLLKPRVNDGRANEGMANSSRANAGWVARQEECKGLVFFWKI